MSGTLSPDTTRALIARTVELLREGRVVSYPHEFAELNGKWLDEDEVPQAVRAGKPVCGCVVGDLLIAAVELGVSEDSTPYRQLERKVFGEAARDFTYGRITASEAADRLEARWLGEDA